MIGQADIEVIEKWVEHAIIDLNNGHLLISSGPNHGLKGAASVACHHIQLLLPLAKLAVEQESFHRRQAATIRAKNEIIEQLRIELRDTKIEYDAYRSAAAVGQSNPHRINMLKIGLKEMERQRDEVRREFDSVSEMLELSQKECEQWDASYERIQAEAVRDAKQRDMWKAKAEELDKECLDLRSGIVEKQRDDAKAALDERIKINEQTLSLLTLARTERDAWNKLAAQHLTERDNAKLNLDRLMALCAPYGNNVETLTAHVAHVNDENNALNQALRDSVKSWNAAAKDRDHWKSMYEAVCESSGIERKKHETIAHNLRLLVLMLDGKVALKTHNFLRVEHDDNG